MKRKKKLIDPYSVKFQKMAANLALANITIKQCRDCGCPVHEGYCCSFCGSDNPSDWNDESIMCEV